jgi:curli biogenesis system outer membrane secretion channel CsgG
MRSSVWKAAFVVAVAACLVGLTPTAVRAQGSQRPTVAVLDFDYGTIQQWWTGTWDIGKGISDMIVDELVNDGSYRVIERRRLDAILSEQDFSNSERADPSAKTVAKVGKALGVKYLIVGSVTKFGLEEKRTGIDGGGGGAGALGGVEMTSSDFHDTILGEATEMAVKATVAKLVAAKSRLQ